MLPVEVMHVASTPVLSLVECQIKVLPAGIEALDQLDLPAALPAFDALLCADGRLWILKCFVIDQQNCTVFLAEC